jgi:hypothetical protein
LFQRLAFKVRREIENGVLWLIYLGLAMLAGKWLAAESIRALNARFTSASTAHANFQTLTIQ